MATQLEWKHRVQIINGVLAQVHLTVGPMGLQTHHLVMYLVPEYTIGMEIFSSSQKPNIGSLTCEIRAITIERDKGTPDITSPLPSLR